MSSHALIVVGDDGILTRQAMETAQLCGLTDVQLVEQAPQISEQQCVFVALSDQEQRKALVKSLSADQLINLVHPTAFVSPDAHLAGNVLIGAQAIVGSKATVGLGVVQNALSSIEHDDVIGDFCFLGTGAILCGRVITGEDVFIGGGATVKPGIRIGARSVLGTGAVLVKDVEPDCVYVGNPAKAIQR